MQTNVSKALDELEFYHWELKKEYLGWAKEKLPDNGIES